MADAELKVRIDAEIGGLSTSLKKGEQDLKSFTNKVDANLKKTAQSAASLSGQLGGSVTKGTDQAAFALNNLSRVAQDAPFGFIGIQNNLNPLLESFQRLKKETGSTGSALKALGSSLLGAGGLGFALSLVSAGLLIYQQYQQRSNKETKKAVDLNKELADSILTISGVEQEGRANASKDLSQLQSLYKATQNDNLAKTERLKIAKELIRQNPEILKGLTAEEIVAGKAAVAYQKLTTSILAKGLAQAGEANRQKLVNQKLEQEIQLVKAQDALTAARAKQKAPSQAIPGIAAAFEPLQLADQVKRASDSVTKLNLEIVNTENQIKLVDDVVAGLVNKNGTNILFDPEKPKVFANKVKTVSDILKELNVDLKQADASVDGTFGSIKKEKVTAFAKAIDSLIASGVNKNDPLIKNLQSQSLAITSVQNSLENYAKTIQSLQKPFTQSIPQNIITPETLVAVDLRDKLVKPFDEWGTYLNGTLLPKIQTNFESFFNNILEKGTFSFAALGGAILKTLGSVLASEAAAGITGLLSKSQGSDFTDQKKKGGLLSLVGGLFAKKAIGAVATGGATAAATGGTAAVAGATAASGGLLLPILAGVGAIAGIVSLFKKKPAAPQPAYSTSAATTSSASAVDFGSGRVVFEISGVNLIGVLNRAGAKLQRFGP